MWFRKHSLTGKTLVHCAPQTRFIDQLTPGRGLYNESISRRLGEEFGRLEGQIRSALCGILKAAQAYERIRLALALTADIRVEALSKYFH
jgi:hypothetical protein